MPALVDEAVEWPNLETALWPYLKLEAVLLVSQM
jgi:hypothetical protein